MDAYLFRAGSLAHWRIRWHPGETALASQLPHTTTEQRRITEREERVGTFSLGWLY